MRIRRSFLFAALIFVTVAAQTATAQEVPDTPDVPEPAPAAEAAPTAGAEPTADPQPATVPSLLFETTIDFELVKKIQLDGRAGEIDIRGVEFGSKSSKSGIFGTSDADLKASVTAQLDCSTTAEKKRKIDFTIQYLDGEGNLIDRATGSGSVKDEAKIIAVEHTTLKYVVPMIKRVRISAEAKAK